MRKIVTVFFFFSAFVQAQFEDLDDVASDLIFLTEKYITPAAKASVYQSASGWYTNLRSKNKFDTEFSLQYNILFIPKKYKTFVINEAQLTNLQIQGSSTTATVPSALGGDNVVVLQGHIGDENFEFDSPEGVGQSAVKHGQIQATIGLWKQTNFIARYAPKIKINETKYSSFGFGITHQLNQWIKPLQNSSYIIAFMPTFTNYRVTDNFSEADLTLGKINEIHVEGNSYSFNLITAKSIKQFDLSAAVGLATTKFQYKVGGSGDFLLKTLNQALKDLNKSDTNFKFDFNVNYRIKYFSINSMLTFGKFSNINVGVNYNLN